MMGGLEGGRGGSRYKEREEKNLEKGREDKGTWLDWTGLDWIR